ncbi:MAG: calcineurin-like phosphoesterase family protein [bacterium]|nr:calcineurin-like phosphoesterase family protein [bacterium]
MNKRRVGWLVFVLWFLFVSATQAQRTATGVVFHDINRNGVRDSQEPGIANVLVSNQREVVRTDKQGRYRLPVEDDTILFVIKPRGWQVPLNENRLPQHYYIHKPKGSPKLRFPGVPPTGELPASVDFALVPQRESERFTALIFGDTQPRDLTEVGYIARDVVRELVGTKQAQFVALLGDILFDDLDLFAPLNRVIAQIGVPIYAVLGNHDIDFESPNDEHSDETFERVYGPPYYAYEYGRVSFIVLDDVVWSRPNPQQRGGYVAGLGEKQLQFVQNYLRHVPRNNLVVLMMHIPLWEIPEQERKSLFEALRPFEHTLSFSAHTHIQTHYFFQREQGWFGKRPHHHVNAVTVSGSWWTGVPDPTGIPHTTMRDGAPNGYLLVDFDGNRYTIRYKAARYPEDYQMNIYAPDFVSASQLKETRVLVNVFFGSERCRVEMRVGDSGEWIPMARVQEPDPAYAEMKKLEEQYNLPGRRLPGLMNSPHLWTANLPANLTRGVHVLTVKVTDLFGRTWYDRRILTVR